MKFLAALCILKLLIGLTLAQEEFKLTVEKVEVISFNKEYIADPYIVVFQYNETNQGINASGKLLKDLGMKLRDNIEIYGIEEGEPRLISTANDVMVCDVLTSGFPEIEELFKFGNFTKCPMLKGIYGATNAVVDLTNIPPSIPRGQFLIDIKSYDDDILLIHSKSHVLVEDVPPKKEK
ncbi:hypothetical protein ILUMI_03866 [Ignelater luminosus]|uniref:Uncharacterized protein n=1 Tax=Ignelater luminosus TaxID=2038154 RepID=A0A8K0DAR1_IGNLU|nr:hypothetical protein ILUMI_03866 [Ignelater luminosus]